MNVKVLLEYDGAGFSGWQQQLGQRTVEGELKRVLHELTGEHHTVYAAGRTDAGAHALGQVVSFQLLGRIRVDRLAGALNARLPDDVAVLSAESVPDEFHARFGARWRTYRYRWLDRTGRPALDRGRCWHVDVRLDENAMAEAALGLVGRHDWTTFCAASEPAADRVRELRGATVHRRGDLVDLELVGEGFLRGMVRGIAGALREVGEGRRPPGWPAELLAARNRSLAPRTAPAGGLTLVEVVYPPTDRS